MLVPGCANYERALKFDLRSVADVSMYERQNVDNERKRSRRGLRCLYRHDKSVLASVKEARQSRKIAVTLN